MENLEFENILIIAIFFIPGFIYLKAYRLFLPEVKTDFSKDLYEAIGLSFINAIIFSYPIFYIHSNDLLLYKPVIYFLVFFFVILVAPIIAAYFFFYLSKRKVFSKYLISPTKSAWDSFFSKRDSYFVIVTLKSGVKIGGKYGLNSFASTFPHPNEIYLEELWELNVNNGFEKRIDQTEGILITENEISTIEFYL